MAVGADWEPKQRFLWVESPGSCRAPAPAMSLQGTPAQQTSKLHWPPANYSWGKVLCSCFLKGNVPSLGKSQSILPIGHLSLSLVKILINIGHFWVGFNCYITKWIAPPFELGSAQGFFLLVFPYQCRPRLALRGSQAWVLCKAAL